MSTVMRMVLWLVVAGMGWSSSFAIADPPARVGRLALVEGSVALRIDGQAGESPAELNWPVTGGTSLYTAGDGRAEVQLGANTFRLAGDSAAAFTVVDDRRIAVQLIQGSLAVTARDREQAEEIDIATSAGQVRLGEAGSYRVDAMGRNGDVRLASRQGLAYFYRPGGEMSVQAGRQGIIYGRGGWYVEDLRMDAFDDWVAARDASADAAIARRHVSPRMTGYEDLDRYGEWSNASGYGAVWYPRSLPVGWAPYRYGRWAWIAPWGWTWVDEAAWGFAPFHYGRWSLIGGRWGWIPGTYIAQPVYAPALVAWVGSSGWSVSFSFGTAPALGWFPLAAWEVYYPAYRYSPSYLRQINGGHVGNLPAAQATLPGPPGQRIRTALANSALPQAVTVVPANTFRTGSPVAPAALARPDQQMLSRAPIASGGPAAAGLAPAPSAGRPLPAEVRGMGGGVAAAIPPGRPGETTGRGFQPAQEAQMPLPDAGGLPARGARVMPSGSNLPPQGAVPPVAPSAGITRPAPFATQPVSPAGSQGAAVQAMPQVIRPAPSMPAAASTSPPPRTSVSPAPMAAPYRPPVVASPPPVVSPSPRIIAPPPAMMPAPAPSAAPSPPPGGARPGQPAESRGGPGRNGFRGEGR